MVRPLEFRKDLPMRALLCLALLALTAGCATTTSGEPVFRLRPKDSNNLGEATSKYTGGFEAIVSFPEFDDFGATEFKSPESTGFRVHARPSSWFVAPEGGLMFTEETNGGVELESLELFAGGRITARMTELPVEFYTNAGLSYLDSSVGPSDDTSTGFYFGGGTNVILGGDSGITVGAGFRFVDHDWDLDSWTEFLVSVGLSW